MEDLYFFQLDSISDVVIAENDLFQSLFCELFWLVHAGVGVNITLGWNRQFNLVQVLQDVYDMLNNFCAFIGGPEFGLKGAKTCVRLTDAFPCNAPPPPHQTEEDNESSH